MSGARKYVGFLLPPALAYSARIHEGLMRNPRVQEEWMVIECPHFEPGRSPLFQGGAVLDAAIVWAEPRDTWVRDLVARGTRVLSCGTEWENTPGVASAYFDRPEMHHLLIAHLQGLGLQRAVGMGHRLGLRPRSRQLIENFAAMARREGIDAQVWSLEGEGSPAMAPGRLLQAHAEHELADFLRSLTLPCAVVCASDQMAVIVCEVASRLGLRVPEDLAVIGESDNPLAATSNPPLSSIAGDAVALGEAAAELLLDWLGGEAPPAKAMKIPGARLVVRESTAGRTKDAAIERVRRLVESKAIQGISLGELVTASGLSTKTLVRRYEAAFGIDPVEEVNQRRLAEAKRLLGEGKLKATEVAARCGFSSQAAFNNYFRRHAGCAPSAYQEDEAAKLGEWVS
ncbi:substrate-binding domain-containing protein [Haloferula sp. BvORR071]|uniref:AraC family transcriptional regulator n=1 Tax=Haloferula sp. BvORR071 TaxID=1396141 RepID=UPI0005526AC0|nr:substrate-binding domain-containing protein [Haloferula sp. BvORR071]